MLVGRVGGLLEDRARGDDLVVARWRAPRWLNALSPRGSAAGSAAVLARSPVSNNAASRTDEPFIKPSTGHGAGAGPRRAGGTNGTTRARGHLDDADWTLAATPGPGGGPGATAPGAGHIVAGIGAFLGRARGPARRARRAADQSRGAAAAGPRRPTRPAERPRGVGRTAAFGATRRQRAGPLYSLYSFYTFYAAWHDACREPRPGSAAGGG